MLLCGIMIEAAAIDGTVDQDEILKIKTSLVSISMKNLKKLKRPFLLV